MTSDNDRVGSNITSHRKKLSAFTIESILGVADIKDEESLFSGMAQHIRQYQVTIFYQSEFLEISMTSSSDISAAGGKLWNFGGGCKFQSEEQPVGEPHQAS